MQVFRGIAVFLGTVVIYLGIPVIGWGGISLPAFFISPVRSAYALVAALFSLLIGVQAYFSMEGIQDSKGLRNTLVTRQTVVGSVLVGLLAVSLAVLPFTSRHGIGVYQASKILSWIGVLLTAVGYLLIYWSGRALGRQYSAEVVLQQDHRLVTSGPYHLVRHPRYLGVINLACGVSLIFNSWIGLLLCLPVAGLVLLRIQDEEKLLKNAFGNAWITYCQCSWRLVPFLY